MVAPDVWRRSLDDRLTNYETDVDLDGYVWGVRWQALYPGMRLVHSSAAADRWSRRLGHNTQVSKIAANTRAVCQVFAARSALDGAWVPAALRGGSFGIAEPGERDVKTIFVLDVD